MNTILIIDFGSQYTKLIAKLLRKNQVYCQIINPTDTLSLNNVDGVILSGGPSLVRDDDLKILSKITDIPILGICYGAQLLATNYGLQINNTYNREYGKTPINLQNDIIFSDIPNQINVWMSHSNSIIDADCKLEIISRTQNNISGFKINQKTYGLLFHPEVSHSEFGETILNNFLFKICLAKQNWTPDYIIPSIINRIKTQVGNKQVIMAISGGVDSTVAATLINQAIQDKLICLFVNNGLLRKNEYPTVLQYYQNRLHLNVVGVDESQLFLERLDGVNDPEEKRKIIGKTFIDVFQKFITSFSNPIYYLGQGTIYSDVIESSGSGSRSHKIKSHHNVGGLPSDMKLQLVEPLRDLFKDEVREIGRELKIPNEIVDRHPFPGPGLAIRIMGDITTEKVKILQEADHIFINFLKDNNLYHQIWQAGAILLSTKTVGVMGDERTYQYVLALRAVISNEGMTAKCYPFDMTVLEKIATKIVNNINGINRVVYDISSKPPSTIEWE